MSKQKSGPAPAKKPVPTPTDDDNQSTVSRSEFDYDRSIVDRVDESLWRAVYNGEFRLAVRCSRCGRWLCDGRSKRAGMGPRCAAKAVTQ